MNLRKLEKEEKGITLIALVITIVVLLILAGITISTLLGENGLIKKAQDAKDTHRVAQIREEIELWKENNKIAEYTKDEKTSIEDLLNKLLSSGIVNESEIDRTNEMIIIGNTEIPYGIDLTINIAKTYLLDDETGPLLLTASIDGGRQPMHMEMREYAEALTEKLKTMTDDENKALLRKLTMQYLNTIKEMYDVDLNINSYEDYIELMYNEGQIAENTEEAFYNTVKETDDFMALVEIIYMTKYPLIGYYDDAEEQLTYYKIENPDGELYDKYTVLSSGDYTFTITDIVTNKQYNKTIKIENVNVQTDSNYLITSIEGEEEKATPRIRLIDTLQNESVTFEKAYMAYNGKFEDVSDCIYTSEDGQECRLSGWNIFLKMRELDDNDYGKVRTKLKNKTQTFLIKKGDIWIKGDTILFWVE